MQKFLTNFGTTLLLLAAIATGSLIGSFTPTAADRISGWVDPLILALVSLLFFEISLSSLAGVTKHLRFLSVAWVANFILIPLIGWGIASLFLSGKTLLYTGLLIYFIAPCTDWFLGFTKLAKGNASLGSVLIPINLISQLLLYPVFLGLFAGKELGIDIAGLAGTLWQWFLLPFVCAIVLHQILRRVLPASIFTALLHFVGSLIPFTIAGLVVCIFAGNITTILSHVGDFLIILGAVFCFFVATWFLGEILTRRFKLKYPEHALLTMTTAARNAPLMLGLTTAAFPNQPLIYAALIIGMLVEFPHLTALKHLLLRKAPGDINTSEIPASIATQPAKSPTIPPSVTFDSISFRPTAMASLTRMARHR
jgi:arsenite transporter